jgi:catechol 2,3-dioxygenase-like lactoylglutathione lyase family enzyme
VSASAVSIDELTLADEPERWAAFGFAVEGDACRLGAVTVRLVGAAAGRGIVGWSLRGIAPAHAGGLDGLPTRASAAPRGEPARPQPNGVTAIDHIVAMTPDLDRTVDALLTAGLDLRRVREEPTPAGAPRQAFFRLGAEILEVVQEPAGTIAARGGTERPAQFWGLALAAPEIERTVAAFAGHARDPHDAVQPGRRIATVGRSAGLTVPLALITAPERVPA